MPLEADGPVRRDGPARLLLGPQLRYAGETDATVWVETTRACEIDVLGRRERTFEVAGHHYAIVCLHDLEPGCELPYEVHLDGTRVWPEPDSPFPPSLIRTVGDGPLQLAFGSCRVSLPHDPPFALTKDRDERGREVDALYALVPRMRRRAPAAWPDTLLLLGDQVYADEVSPDVRARIARRRRLDEGVGPEVADFEEYTWLYHESFGDPAIRWLLSTVPSAMIFDDHDVHDDWNTSAAWMRDIRAEPWWEERILGAYATYWIYQHLGNLSPAELAQDGLLAQVRVADGDAAPLVKAFARKAHEEVAGTRWSYRRDLGRTRLLVLDSRAGRVLDERQRQMLSDREWAWVTEEATGDFDHLLIATSLPVLLSSGLHHLEAWSEAVCGGAWGDRAALLAERLRQALDLEHWAAFGGCFEHMARLLREVGSGQRGPAPASIVILSGDVHHAYLAEAGFPRDAGVTSSVVQAVCSPVRNPLNSRERRALRSALSKPAELVGRVLARAAGVRKPSLGWRFPEDPTFDNQVATLLIAGREARLLVEKTRPEDWADPMLHVTLDRVIAGPADGRVARLA
ncbi:MAG: hypothetical protein QOG11_1750 [Solirubrobacteraceae bacterium]|nr:hypothetical protein [Solirubrobacteraceae bacterium]